MGTPSCLLVLFMMLSSHPIPPTLDTLAGARCCPAYAIESMHRLTMSIPLLCSVLLTAQAWAACLLCVRGGWALMWRARGRWT